MASERVGYTVYVKDEATGEFKKIGLAAETTGKKMSNSLKSAEESASQLGRTLGRLQRTIVAFAGVYVFRELTSGLKALIDVGIDYNKVLERSKIGISAVIAAQMKGGDAAKNLASANSKAVDIIRDLRKANLETAATFPQLITMFQQALPHALAEGFNIKQVEEFVVAMSQAATSMGIPLNMMAEEMRAMLKGTINEKNTLIAVALDVDKALVKSLQGNSDALFQYLMSKLQSFKLSGISIQNSFEGMLTNMSQAFQEAVGNEFKPLFEDIKHTMSTVTDAFKDEEFKASIRDFVFVLRTILELGELGIKLNGVLSKLGDHIKFPTIGNVVRAIREDFEDISFHIDKWTGKINEFGGQVVRMKIPERSQGPKVRVSLAELKEEQNRLEALAKLRSEIAASGASLDEENAKAIDELIIKYERLTEAVSMTAKEREFYNIVNRLGLIGDEAGLDKLREMINAYHDAREAIKLQKEARESLYKSSRLERALESPDTFFGKIEVKDEIEAARLQREARESLYKSGRLEKALEDPDAYYGKMKTAAEETSDALITLSRRTAEAMEQNFSDFFFDALTGQFKTLRDYALAILRSIQRAYADYLGQMTKELLFGTKEDSSKGFMAMVAKAAAGYFTGGGAGATAGTGTSYTGISANSFHSGGIVGESIAPQVVVPASIFSGAPRLHSGLRSDEFPAILQRGETVIPRGGGVPTYNIQINAVDSKSFADLVERNPQAITAVVSHTLRDGGLRTEIREATG